MFHERRLFHVGIGAELRKLRERSRMSTRTVGKKLGTSPAWVSRTETGSRRPKTDEVLALCALYGVSGELRDRLVQKANENYDEVLGLPSGDEYSDQLANVIVLENEAAAVTEYGPTVIPGLLQTADYARALFSTVDRTQAEVERRIATRMARQALLTRTNGPQLYFIVDELALYRRVGGTEVMREQLEYLAESVRSSSAHIRVLPTTAGAHPGLDGPFITYEFGALDPYVHLENRKGGVFLSDPEETGEYRDVCARLHALAHGREESAELIRSVAEGLG